jgi:hypothetical protein
MSALGDLFTSELFWAALAVVILEISLIGNLFALFRHLEGKVDNAVSASQPQRSGNSASLPNGYILVVRHAGKYGALQAVEQRIYPSNRRPFIWYAWWYQPDGSGIFSSPNTQRGFSAAQEPFTWDEIHESSRQNTPLRVDRWPVLKIGPIHLQWSSARDGRGHVYFGPPFHYSDEYELAVTNEVDITKVDGSQLKFFRRSAPS